MEITKTVLSYEKIEESSEKLPVIIVAAGSSTRMQGTNKQFLELKGVPVLIRTVSKFQQSEFIGSIILVVKSEDVLKVQKLCEEYELTKVSDIVAGGDSRTASVKNGLSAIAKGERCVLIHDGGRPFVTQKIIGDVVKALNTCDCALAAIKAIDTVKQTDNESTVVKTLDREKIYLAQTPQGVNIAKYRFAINSLNAEEYTDDASVMEKMGYKCVVCEGSPLNIKITKPEDIIIANAIAEAEEEEK